MPKCEGILDSAEDREFTREEWLAWYEEEFAGYDPEPLITDDCGETQEREDLFAAGYSKDDVDWLVPEPIQVSQHQIAQDRLDFAHLGRVWRNTYLISAEGGRTIRGEHPFSVDEGAAEWLDRTRSELRQSYREARTDGQRAALVNREAALRARHNARCYARAFAEYHNLDARDTARFLDGWRDKNKIGWLGIERQMKSLFESCFDHYSERMDHWRGHAPSFWALDGKLISRPTREEQDAWLDAEPVKPVYPTQIVTSAKKIRPYTPDIPRTRKLGAFEVASSERLSFVARQRARRGSVADAVRGSAAALELPAKPTDEDIATWVEFTRAEVEYEKREVPEHGPAMIHGDLCAKSCWCQRGA